MLRLRLDRDQILEYRRTQASLDSKSPMSREAVCRAAWAGLRDSMPRAALFSLHARIDDTVPETLFDPPLVQLWGPGFSVYAVAESDTAIFTVGRMPESGTRRSLAESLADRLRQLLGDGRMTYGEAGRELGVDPNQLRYAALTGAVRLFWDGARQPTIWLVPPPQADPVAARNELARRYLHLFAPTTPESFARWAGIRDRRAVDAFEALQGEMIRVDAPTGHGWVLGSDEDAMREGGASSDAVRLLPSGDTYFLLWGADRDLLVPDADQQSSLWTSRVWPGAILVAGEIVGTWRRSRGRVTIQPWTSLSKSDRYAVGSEAESLPVPDVDRVTVKWE